MLVMYYTKGESLVADLENEDVLLKSLLNEEHGRKATNYKRIEGEIFVIPHNLTVYYTTLDE